MERGRLTSIETKQERSEERKQKFLEIYPEVLSMSKAAEMVGITHFGVAWWLKHDPEFAQQYYKLKEIRDISREEEEEDFLHDVGVGTVKIGKETGIGMPSIVAAKMSLVAKNPKKWSEKLYREDNKHYTITTIEVVRDSLPPVEGEFKELPSGE